jgi:hypothetical protein
MYPEGFSIKISVVDEIRHIIELVAEKWKGRNENKFRLCRNVIAQNRHSLSLLALRRIIGKR